MATRTTTTKKPVNLNPTQNVSSEQVILDQEMSLGDKMKALVDDTYKALGIPVPSWQRTLIAVCASFIAGAGIGMLFNLIDMLVISSLLPISVFLYWAVWTVGFVLALYAAFKAGQAIGTYIALGDIDRDLARMKNAVKGWFTRTPAPALAAA